MQKQTIYKEVYVTADGAEFSSEKEALAHEKEMELRDELSKFEFKNGPSEKLPSDPWMLKGYRYKWYKVNSRTELNRVLELLSILDNRRCNLNNWDKFRAYYPEYICYSWSFGNIHFLSSLKAQIADLNREYERLFNYFNETT